MFPLHTALYRCAILCLVTFSTVSFADGEAQRFPINGNYDDSSHEIASSRHGIVDLNPTGSIVTFYDAMIGVNIHLCFCRGSPLTFTSQSWRKSHASADKPFINTLNSYNLLEYRTLESDICEAKLHLKTANLLSRRND